MVNLELLKKITFIADITQRLEPIDFEGSDIKINTLLSNHEDVQYAFKVLNIPFSTYEPDYETASPPDEINVSFGLRMSLKSIYLLTYVLKEIYGSSLDAYISYAIEPDERQFKTIVGSYITREKDYTNISRPISFSEILVLDILNLEDETFKNLFPNNNYSEDGRCIYISSENEDYDYDDYDDYDNYGSSYTKYGGYNDWSDDIIDDVFDGDPEATWNID